MNRILIVSSNPILSDIVRTSLVGVRADVRTVSDVGEMVRICHRMIFDTIVFLYVTPFLNGGDVVRSVRPAGLKRPLFYVVSWPQSEQTVQSLLECGVDQYMNFPLDPQRLRLKIANGLRRQL